MEEPEQPSHTLETGLQSTDAPSRFGRYSDSEVGAELLVDTYLLDRHLYVQYRTIEERTEASLTRADIFATLPAPARDRFQFEFTAELILWSAEEARPDAIKEIEVTLETAFFESLRVCAANSEWPEISIYEKTDIGYETGPYYLYEVTAQQYEITWDDYVDLRHECSKYAASYPALEPEDRQHLLASRHEYYLDALHAWMRDNPDLVVPLDYERSVNHPYQDYVREVCLAADDPEECARQEGVALP